MPLSAEEKRKGDRMRSKKYYEKNKETIKAWRKAYYYSKRS
jgi:hypothetical protein